MQNLLDDLKELFQQDERLMVEGNLLKSRIIELALKMDGDLIKLLLSHPRLRQHFFVEVAGVVVFDKERFLQFVSNKAFLPDSYTAFSNKIGLTDDGGRTYLSRHRDVVLAWPYKDCVLEGGQTKEDAKRSEVFWNMTLAPDDIDRLLDPKALTNFRRIDADGERAATEIADSDNLIIKGNNLLALHSLLPRFRGRVKLIYIDPPYNTGSDSFGYNDSFTHSTWLTFMRNRLEIARDLLHKNGSIWMNIDDYGAHYLKVLVDEIFGRENFVRNVLWQKRTSPDTRATIGDGHDHILVFARNIEWFKETVNRLPLSEKRISEYRNPDDDPRGPWASVDLTGQVGHATENQFYEIVTPAGARYPPPEGRCWALAEATFVSLIEEGKIWFGQDGTSRPRLKKYLSEAEGTAVWSWWTNSEVGHNQEAKKESIALFGVSNPFSTPKPERLLQRIIHIASNEGDIVLDFFAGSGTAVAVAHKMGRQFITIEQMDYVETFTIDRLRKVIGRKGKKDGEMLETIEYDRGGISKAMKWQGGGSVVVCELVQWNGRYVDQIQAAQSAEELQALWEKMQEQAFLSYKVDYAQFDEHAEEFAQLSLADQKRFLLEVLDKNQLYVNLSEIDDTDYQVSEEDKRLNRMFYKQERSPK